jgi:hypothetical protein
VIRAYVGRMGEGKTLSLVKDAIGYLNEGLNVFTNIHFTNPPKPKTMFKKEQPSKQPIILNTKGLEEALLTEQHCLFAVDEGNIVFPAHYWKNLSPDYEMMFAQSRKIGCDIFYTSQLFTHTASRLRDLTQEILQTTKRGFFGHKFFINKCYDPERYRPDFFNPFQEQNALLWNRKIYWWEAEKLYKCYNTYKLIEVSSAYQGKGVSRLGTGQNTNFNPQKIQEIPKQYVDTSVSVSPDKRNDSAQEYINTIGLKTEEYWTK